MLSETEKRDKIKHYLDRRTEVEFMKEVLRPLFDNMSYMRVDFTHGIREHGKDFVLASKDEMGEIIYTAVIVKNENIRNTSKGEKETLVEVMRQVDQAESISIDVFLDLPKKLPSKIVVVTSGLISDSAEEEIKKNLRYVSRTNLSFIDQNRLVQIINEKFPAFFKSTDPYLSDYLCALKESIISDTSQDVFSSGILGKFEVKCRMVDSEEQKDNDSPRSFKYETGVKIFEEKDFFWIQGGFGSGKTYTLVQYVESLERSLGNKELDIVVPIYIKAQYQTTYKIEEILKDNLGRHIKFFNNEGFQGFLNNYKLLVIVDEFEKIIYKNGNIFIESLNKYLKDQKLKRPYRIGLMSREFTAYKQDFSVRFDIWNIVDTNFNQMIDKLKKDFVEKNVERYRRYRDMAKDGMLKRIPKTPLALNILYQVFSSDFDKTPQNLFEFFDLYFELVLGRWSKSARDTSIVTDYSQVRPLLEELSFTMCEKDVSVLETGHVIARIDKYLKDVGNLSVNREQYLQILASNSEIVAVDNGRFWFKERVFQEFLCGCHIAKHSWKREFLLDKILSPTWQEPIIFAAGSKNRDNEFLMDLGKITTNDIDDKFSKLRVISLVTQALYHSDEQEKCNAIKTSLELIVDIRNDSDLKKIIKRKLRFAEEFYYTLVTLSSYNYVCSRNTLLLPFVKLLPLVSNQQKSYIIAALCTLEIPSQLEAIVNDGLKTIKCDPTLSESSALGVIFKAQDRIGALPQMFSGKILTSFYKKSVKVSATPNFLSLQNLRRR